MKKSQWLINKSKKSEKQQIWETKLKELSSVVDNEGTPIDKDILETVAALNLNGFPTIKSCAGHTQMHPLAFPFILGWADGRPENRFDNDKKIRQTIARKHRGFPAEIEFNPLATKEYFKIVEKRGLKETKEYQEWDKKNIIIQKTIRSFLRQFYSKRNVSKDMRIYLPKTKGVYLVMVGNPKIKKRMEKKDLIPSEKLKIEKNITDAQKEIKLFTEFLNFLKREKLFSQCFLYLHA